MTAWNPVGLFGKRVCITRQCGDTITGELVGVVTTLDQPQVVRHLVKVKNLAHVAIGDGDIKQIEEI